MPIPARLIEFLDKNRVRYEIIRHPEAFTAQELADLEHVKGRYHAKVVMVNCDGRQVMTVLPSDHLVDLEKVEKITGKAASVASEEEFKALFPDCAVGTMPPFGHLYGLLTWVDKSLAQDDYIVFEAGTHTDAIKLSYRDYAELEQPTIEDFAVKLHSMKAASERV